MGDGGVGWNRQSVSQPHSLICTNSLTRPLLSSSQKPPTRDPAATKGLPEGTSCPPQGPSAASLPSPTHQKHRIARGF
ncbi:hypothetical protein Pmani_035601 [Petrolisthes manimaculis]|uniref:Uncharacterized protein n=1 Tax=Petrolisthes manimaculis TaxID=1843537 RepID=A0AAE1NLY8_9EUCA|nr:hypothetical protein Pmani_035601 [Petrolisthes manimaculis]